MGRLALPEAGPQPQGLPPALTGLRRTLVMGIVNVTPDSFSDGGRFLALDSALAQAMALVEAGADLIDVGGESTRPMASRVAPDVERQRVLPVIAAIAEQGIPVSIDTMNAATAQSAVDSGAILVNDVSGGLADPDMLPAVAALDVPYVTMHWRGETGRPHDAARYDVVSDVARHLADRVEHAVACGIAPELIIVDPGLGFGKAHEHNWAVLGQLDSVVPAGFPVLVGASRKRFIGALLAGPAGLRPVDHRDDATLAITTLAAAAGAWCVRVHEAGASADAVRVVAAWRAGEVRGEQREVRP